MTTDRHFCRFASGRAISLGKVDENTLTEREIPQGGLCLSAFLVISAEPVASTRVLMGHLNPNAPWDHIGALDQSRVQVHSKGWMLPSSHLIIHESPGEAARRIAREQLGLPQLPISGPLVLSEVYTPRRFPDLPEHWDLEFVFRGHLPESDVPRSDAWLDLRFVDTSLSERSEIARSHEDVLESVGFRFAR